MFQNVVCRTLYSLRGFNPIIQNNKNKEILKVLELSFKKSLNETLTASMLTLKMTKYRARPVNRPFKFVEKYCSEYLNV